MSVQTGLSEQGKMDKGYKPRDDGQGQRPAPPKAESAGKFKIK